MKLNHILNKKTVHFVKEWDGQPVEWDALENALTPRILNSFVSIAEKPLEMANSLAEMITDWNVFVEVEGDFPPNAENLATLPVDFLSFLVEAMAEIWQGGKPQDKSQSTSAG